MMLDDWLQQKMLLVLDEDDPCVDSIFIAAGFEPLAHKQLGRVTQFDQLPPCPERVVLAVALAKVLECKWMLPEIALMKQLLVRQVLTPRQPVANVVDATHLHAALALEIPRKHSKRAGAEALR